MSLTRWGGGWAYCGLHGGPKKPKSRQVRLNVMHKIWTLTGPCQHMKMHLSKPPQCSFGYAPGYISLLEAKLQSQKLSCCLWQTSLSLLKKSISKAWCCGHHHASSFRLYLFGVCAVSIFWLAKFFGVEEKKFNSGLTFFYRFALSPTLLLFFFLCFTLFHLSQICWVYKLYLSINLWSESLQLLQGCNRALVFFDKCCLCRWVGICLGTFIVVPYSFLL